MRSTYKKLGPRIREVNVRNVEDRRENLLGVSTQKVFMASIANTIGTNFKKYKVVKRGQFTYVPDTSRRGDRIGLALLETHDWGLVSNVYTVFEVIDEEQLLPEYLMMWFRRPEFDRYARFKSHGSVRELFGWDEMCDVELPIPSIEKQREIVKEYQTVVDRIQLNERLNEKLEEATQAIYKQWFVDFEFPITAEYAESIGKLELAGQPYKSSGGEMVYNEVPEQEVPKGWDSAALGELGAVKGGKRLPTGESLVQSVTEHPYIKVADLGTRKFATLTAGFEYLKPETHSRISRYIVKAGDLIVSIVGTIGIVKLIDESLDGANLTENCAKLTDRKQHTGDLLYHYLVSQAGQREIEMRTVGGVQGKLPLYNIASLPCLCPDDSTRAAFAGRVGCINRLSAATQREIDSLGRLSTLLLTSIARMDN